MSFSFPFRKPAAFGRNFFILCSFICCLPPAPAACAETSPAAAPQDSAKSNAAQPATNDATLELDAHLTESSPPLRQGLQWRIYGARPGADNALPLLAQSAEGAARLVLKPGNYVVFINFGRAEQSRSITLEAGKTRRESFNLNAGGLKLNAVLPDGKINMKQLHFAVYNGAQINEQQPLIDAAEAGDILRLPAGSYHIVCTYGLANAVTRSDVRVEAGKLLEATMQLRAAQIILKLVRAEGGGDALADTSWAIMNDSGDIVREIATANAYIILAEGDYVAVARNKDRIYQKEFTVSSGKDEEIQIPATAQNSVDEDGVD